MALPHARSAQIVSIRPLGPLVPQTPSHAILKAQQLEIVRIVLPAGQSARQNDSPGEFTLLCLEGEVELECDGRTQRLCAGDLLHLGPGSGYGLRAFQDASLLLTLCLVPAR